MKCSEFFSDGYSSQYSTYNVHIVIQQKNMSVRNTKAAVYSDFQGWGLVVRLGQWVVLPPYCVIVKDTNWVLSIKSS